MCCRGMYCDYSRHAQICSHGVNSCLMLWREQVKISRLRAPLKLSPNWIFEPLNLMNIRNDHLSSSIVMAKRDSGTATKYGPKQKTVNKDRGYSQVQRKTNARPRGSSSSGEGKGMASIEDDAGTAQGFAMLAGLKAQLLRSPKEFENQSTDSPQASNSKSKALAAKVFDSNFKGKNFSNPQSEAKTHWHLSNLPPQLTEKEFSKIMRSIQGLSSWKLMVDESRICRGYGYCEVDKDTDRDMILEILSRVSIHGNPILVSFPDSEIVRGSYTHQSTDAQSSDLRPNPGIPTNIMKEQTYAGSFENQRVTSSSFFMEDKQMLDLWKVSSLEVDKDVQLFKAAALPPSPPDSEKQTENPSFLKGQAILEAIMKASIERSKLTRRSRKVSRRAKNDTHKGSINAENFVGEVLPIFINPKWTSELDRLQASLTSLKKLM